MIYDYGCVVGMGMEDYAVESAVFSSLMRDSTYTH